MANNPTWYDLLNLTFGLLKANHGSVIAFIDGLTRRIWSGMSDTMTSLTYEWTDRSPVTFTNWAINEPNNHEGMNEDCVEIYLDVSNEDVFVP